FTNGIDPLNSVDPNNPDSKLRPLIYTLPKDVGDPILGDLVINESGVPTDLIRFTGHTIIFYSDKSTSEPGDATDNDDAADVGITTSRQTGHVINGDESSNFESPGINGFHYVPGVGQIGYIGPGLVTSYTIVSDGLSVPEPRAIVLASILALVGLATCGW